MKIGNKDVQVVSYEGGIRFGGNPQYIVDVDGKRMIAFRQAGIGIWAFQKRPLFSNEECAQFDAMMNEHHAKRSPRVPFSRERTVRGRE